MSQITISTPVAADKADWRRLYDGYTAFYKMPASDEIADRVWGWINDPAHGVEALVARTHEAVSSASLISAACRARSTEALPASSTTSLSIPGFVAAVSPIG
jgi:hypothetical protein